MSTYWYVDIDAPLKPATDASTLGPILQVVGGRDHGGVSTEDAIATGIPFHSRWREQSPAGDDVPPEGWLVKDGVLRARLFTENLTREDAQLPLFHWLSEHVDARIGDVIGSMNVENDDCRGPLLMTEEGVAWCPSTAVPTWAHYDGVIEYPSIDCVPPEMIAAERAWHICDVDVVALEKMLTG